MNLSLAMRHQLLRFGVVGVAAMLVHWLVVVALVPLGPAPLIANVIGFLVAFLVSYSGHRHFTFCAANQPHSQVLPRFFIVACTSFCLNELMYFMLLRYTALGYSVSLAIVLVSVAAITFILSRQWAFQTAAKQ